MKLLNNIAKFFRRLFGYKYILNTNSGEVHVEDNIKFQCSFKYLKKDNKKYLTKRQYNDIKHTYIKRHYIDGCRHCNKVDDTKI